MIIRHPCASGIRHPGGLCQLFLLTRSATDIDLMGSDSEDDQDYLAALNAMTAAAERRSELAQLTEAKRNEPKAAKRGRKHGRPCKRLWTKSSGFKTSSRAYRTACFTARPLRRRRRPLTNW